MAYFYANIFVTNIVQVDKNKAGLSLEHPYYRVEGTDGKNIVKATTFDPDLVRTLIKGGWNQVLMEKKGNFTNLVTPPPGQALPAPPAAVPMPASATTSAPLPVAPPATSDFPGAAPLPWGEQPTTAVPPPPPPATIPPMPPQAAPGPIAVPNPGSEPSTQDVQEGEKQIRIVRESAVKSAASFLANKEKAGADELIALANRLVRFIETGS